MDGWMDVIQIYCTVVLDALLIALHSTAALFLGLVCGPS